MYGDADIARSIRRYLSLLWDEDSGWELRIARRVIADDERPVAVVLLGDRRVLSARTSRDQGNVVEELPVTVYAYPAVGDDEEAATVAAGEIKDLLLQVFEVGLSPDPKDEDQEPAWTTKAGPFNIPLWDYDGVALDKAGPEDPHDVIWVNVDSLSGQNLEDPQDGKRRTVVIEFRASIERPGRIVPEGPPVSEMPGHFGPIVKGSL
jgi:hypothetical protein